MNSWVLYSLHQLALLKMPHPCGEHEISLLDLLILRIMFESLLFVTCLQHEVLELNCYVCTEIYQETNHVLYFYILLFFRNGCYHLCDKKAIHFPLIFYPYFFGWVGVLFSTEILKGLVKRAFESPLLVSSLFHSHYENAYCTLPSRFGIFNDFSFKGAYFPGGFE